MLFAPRDDVQTALHLIVGSATVALKGEQFTYTDEKLDAICHAKALLPGFEFQLTLDESECERISIQAKLFAGWNADPRVVKGKSEFHQIIHRKVWVVDHAWVIGGSTNATYVGERLEDNELAIRFSPALAAFYEQSLGANHQRLSAPVKEAA